MIELTPSPQKVKPLGPSFPLPNCACLKVASSLAPVVRDASRLAEDLLTIAGLPTTIGGLCGWPIAMRIHGDGLKP
ncbi:MAG: hypothetical protein PHU85_19860, partial [Phycisphaerae bacterium]|nr:hypothetical protein [Phycisphaerae bacterium]